MTSSVFNALSHRVEVAPPEFDTQLEVLSRDLGRLQREIRAAGIPVVVIFEGWEAAGKGTAINSLLLALDPRGFQVHTIQPPTKEERFHPPLWRFWSKLPPAGSIAFFDRSWYDRLFRPNSKRGRAEAVTDVLAFEKTLTESGVLLLKFFLHISKKEQANRFKKLRAQRATAWRVDKHDLQQNRDYGDLVKTIGQAIEATQSSSAPWQIVPAHNKRHVTLTVFRSMVAALSTRLQRAAMIESNDNVAACKRVTSGPSLLEDADLSLRIDRESYKSRLSAMQLKLRELEHRIYRERIGVVIVFEGWDAAGKGGCIRRLVSGLDPRGYEVIPVAAPTEAERQHHYLRRFWIRMPKAGHIAILDRSWYGRVLVERVESFCSRRDWMRAYSEISDMESSLVNADVVVLKFWLHIDQEEQLARFTARENTPDKKYKITDEDWRNRERWGDYVDVVRDLLVLTSTKHAPWTVVPANDKLSARLLVLETVAEGIEQGLHRHKRTGAVS
jgi:polyphosphate:AMP phosphotransferase